MKCDIRSLIVWVALGGILISVGIPRVLGGVYAHKATVQLANVLNEKPLDLYKVKAVRRLFGEAVAWHPQATWHRQALSLQLPLVENTTGQAKLSGLNDLQERLQSQLEQTPGNGALWLQLALVQAKLGANPNKALDLSYNTTRWSIPLSGPRLQLGAVMWPILNPVTQQEVIDEVTRRWSHERTGTVLTLNAPQGGYLLEQWARKTNRVEELHDVQNYLRAKGQLSY